MNTYHFWQLSLRPFGHVCCGFCLFQMLIVLTVLFFSFDTFAQVRLIELSDMANMVDLSDQQISPDGKQVVLVVSRPNFKDNRYDSELVLVEIATGAKRVLTYDRPRVRHPRWSPSGDRLAFLDAREKEKTQLFVMSMGGGEAQRITNTPRDVSLFAWRPDGKELAFVTEDEPEERTGEEKNNKSFEVGDNDYLATSAPLPRHIWLVSAEGDTARRLTSGVAGVLNTSVFNPSPETIAWSPDGKLLAFSSQPKPHSGEIARGSLKTLELATGTVRTVAPGPIMATAPSFSPNGTHLAYARPLGPGPLFNPHGIYIAPVSGGEGLCVTDAIDRTFYSARWLPDGKAIIVGGNDFTRSSLWIQPLNGPPRRLDLGAINLSSTSIGRDGALAILGSESHHPVELFYMRSVDAPPKRLTAFNDPLASLHLGKVESITWQGPDGFEEDGVLVYPPDFAQNKKYPLVLVIHGGPMSTSTEAFNLLIQLMAAQDWIVFSPNYRGSDNRGLKYQKAVVNDAGDGPGRDVMAGIAAVKKKGVVDEERIAVSGWSYGGYMTTWLISHYQGWTAAVAGAAVTEYADSYNLSDVNVVLGSGFAQSPWIYDGAQIWREQSPITYANNIKTPTLILSDTGDLRVPITQSYKLYHALKENGIPVEFIAYPIPGHFPGDPVHRRDVYRRWIDWIAQHFDKSYVLDSGEKVPGEWP